VQAVPWFRSGLGHACPLPWSAILPQFFFANPIWFSIARGSVMSNLHFVFPKYRYSATLGHFSPLCDFEVCSPPARATRGLERKIHRVFFPLLVFRPPFTLSLSFQLVGPDRRDTFFPFPPPTARIHWSPLFSQVSLCTRSNHSRCPAFFSFNILLAK